MGDTDLIYDVVIAGAGPVGLFLACELRLAGVSVLVLEKAEEPRSALKQLPLGMRGLSVPTIEGLYRRGMLEEVAVPLGSGGKPDVTGAKLELHWMQQTRRPGGHFAGIQFFHDRIDAGKWPYRLEGPAGTNVATTMERLESVLAARARAAGVGILTGRGVDHFEQSKYCVKVSAGGSDLRCRWLVGCDGGRSAVRKVGNFKFVGTDAEFTGYSVLVEMTDPDQLPIGRRYTPAGMYTYQKPGTIALVDFDGGAFHRTQPITLEHVQSVLRRVSGTEVTLTALRMATTWTDRAYQAATYRDGRVLLAGDAAHIHSPLGGQGLNLGLGDAMNLGWKLAATVNGDAPAGLLDTYVVERHPIGAQVLDWSRAQVAVMRPTPSSRALETIFRDIIETIDGATYFAERVWATRLRYDLGSSHPLVGASAPDFELVDGTRLGEHLRDGRGVLLDFEGGSPLAQYELAGRVGYVGCDARERLGLSAVLVRPDGVVAWAAETAADYETLDQAAKPWFS